MKINREEFLNSLNMVRAGLSPKEFIEQSSCFVFNEGEVMTFNDEMACRKQVENLPTSINGAVQANVLLAILEKITEDELKMRQNDSNELEFRGKNKEFAVTKDGQILLPIDKVETPKESAYVPLAKNFIPMVERVQHCVSKDESRFDLCCVHITPEFVESCDNFQIMRAKVITPIEQGLQIRGSSMKHIIGLAMSEMAVTKNWVHFRNGDGLVMSCRKYAEDYPDLSKMLELEDPKAVTIPKGLIGAADRASVFATDKSGDPVVTISIYKDVLRIRGEGLSGRYKEIKRTVYSGPSIEFNINPELMKYIAERYTEAEIIPTKLKASSSKKNESWVYISSLGVPQEEEEPDDAEDEAEEKPKKRKHKPSED